MMSKDTGGDDDEEEAVYTVEPLPQCEQCTEKCSIMDVLIQSYFSCSKILFSLYAYRETHIYKTIGFFLAVFPHKLLYSPGRGVL